MSTSHFLAMILTHPDEQIEKKSRLYGVIGTTTAGALLFAFLLLFYMPAIFLPENDGILVSFGDSFDGGGTGGDFYGGRTGGGGNADEYAAPQGSVQEIKPATPEKTAPAQTQSAQADNIATQDDMSAATVNQQKQEQERQEQQRIQSEQERAKLAEQQRIAEQQKSTKEIEQKRLAAEAEQQRLAAEARKKQEAIDKADRLGSALAGGSNASAGSGTGHGSGTGTGNASGDGTGAGTGTGAGVGDGTEDSRQGNPVGKGSPTGSWLLKGRELLGSLTPPVYSRNVEGKITVNIRVDKSGVVVSAAIGVPTTISDAETRNAAIVAAKKTRFSIASGPDISGIITY
ncbi:MAG: hypothetical protein LBS07_05540, partial [Prevotellaceae bacterium]|nr:hypothetical protein [Prevotellaceae bacterium]